MSDEIIKNKKLWLSRYLKNKELIERLQNKMILLEDSSDHSMYYLSNDKESLTKRIDRLESRGDIYKSEIKKAINTLNDDNCIKLLKYKFINGYSTDKISELMDHNTRYVYRLCAKSLTNINIPNV